MSPSVERARRRRAEKRRKSGVGDTRSIREMIASGFCSCPPIGDGLTTFSRDCGIAQHRAAAPGDPS